MGRGLRPGGPSEMEETRRLSIHAEGSATCRPDICIVALCAEGHGSTVGGAVAHCEKIVERVVQNIRESFTATIAIKVVEGYTGPAHESPISDSLRPTERVLHVRRLFFTLPADAALAQRVADTALVSGAILSPSASEEWHPSPHTAILYSSSRYDDTRQEALAAAFARASRDAALAAERLGKRCGNVLSAIETFSPDELHRLHLRESLSLPIPRSRCTESSEELKVCVRARLEFELTDST